jgi:hypothetical protein
MKKGDYLAAKEEKRKPTIEAIIVLIVFIIVFLAVIFRFAIRSGTNEGFFSFMPTGVQAYKVSKAFVRPTIHSREDEDVSFPDRDFEYSKKSDSVYVIKSFYVTQDSYGHESKKNYTITLKYNGGSRANGHNWTLIQLQQDK